LTRAHEDREIVMQGTETLWTRTSDKLPPEGVVVETLSEGGIQSLLKRSGRLWFTPDGGMYVYYTPFMWRMGEGDERDGA
jgi:hypothetical protein